MNDLERQVDAMSPEHQLVLAAYLLTRQRYDDAETVTLLALDQIRIYQDARACALGLMKES